MFFVDQVFGEKSVIVGRNPVVVGNGGIRMLLGAAFFHLKRLLLAHLNHHAR
jgi:hypothetical protein